MLTFNFIYRDVNKEEKGDLEMCVLHSRGVQVAVFEGLKQDINYKIKVMRLSRETNKEKEPL